MRHTFEGTNLEFADMRHRGGRLSDSSYDALMRHLATLTSPPESASVRVLQLWQQARKLNAASTIGR